eukprot:scaffold9396_cov100-Isochrysis_galbana.AAC.4
MQQRLNGGVVRSRRPRRTATACQLRGRGAASARAARQQAFVPALPAVDGRRIGPAVEGALGLGGEPRHGVERDGRGCLLPLATGQRRAPWEGGPWTDDDTGGRAIRSLDGGGRSAGRQPGGAGAAPQQGDNEGRRRAPERILQRGGAARGVPRRRGLVKQPSTASARPIAPYGRCPRQSVARRPTPARRAQFQLGPAPAAWPGPSAWPVPRAPPDPKSAQ